MDPLPGMARIQVCIVLFLQESDCCLFFLMLEWKEGGGNYA
jgi:hypothetical protein